MIKIKTYEVEDNILKMCIENCNIRIRFIKKSIKNTDNEDSKEWFEYELSEQLYLKEELRKIKENPINV